MILRPHIPRRKITLLEPSRGSGQRTYREHPALASIQYRSGGIRTSAQGAVEASVESVVFTIAGRRDIEEGWRIRDERDNREFEVRFRQPVGPAERALMLHCRFLQGVQSRIVAP